jgi:hypothetical protein
MSAPAFTVAGRIQAAVRDQLESWGALSGVEVATGPRRKAVGEGITVGHPKAMSTYHGAYRSENGTFLVVVDAFRQGAGESAIDTARERVDDLASEVVAALSLSEQTGGDLTLGGLVLSVGDTVEVEELDNYTEEERARLKGHGYTLGLTFAYTARITTGGSS